MFSFKAHNNIVAFINQLLFKYSKIIFSFTTKHKRSNIEYKYPNKYTTFFISFIIKNYFKVITCITKRYNYILLIFPHLNILLHNIRTNLLFILIILYFFYFIIITFKKNNSNYQYLIQAYQKIYYFGFYYNGNSLFTKMK